MGLKVQSFMKAQFEPRTAEVDVLSLAPFYEGLSKEQKDWVDMRPEQRVQHVQKGGVSQVIPWKVRGQTASEVCRSLEAAKKQENVSSVIEAIAANNDQSQSIKAALGMEDNTPSDIVKRLEQLVVCSVEPEISLPAAVKLAETYPIEFYQLTNKIIELTGLGMNLKKL